MMWFEIKNWLELSTGLDRDSLHIYAGVGVQLAVALCLRCSIANILPWLFVAVAACANEYHDYGFAPDTPEGRSVYMDEAIRDIWNTLLLPSLLLLIARFWPNWLTKKAEAIGNSQELEPGGPPR